jgi:four helix bundle protein
MDQETFNEKFRQRTKRLALEIIRVVSPIKYSDALSVLRKQIIRSSTSVAANFRAVCRGRSERERYAKICIVVEEADETLFWLEMMKEADLIAPDNSLKIEQEATEILKVMSSYKKRFNYQT